jgi:hypothetical protein
LTPGAVANRRDITHTTCAITCLHDGENHPHSSGRVGPNNQIGGMETDTVDTDENISVGNRDQKNPKETFSIGARWASPAHALLDASERGGQPAPAGICRPVA